MGALYGGRSSDLPGLFSLPDDWPSARPATRPALCPELPCTAHSPRHQPAPKAPPPAPTTPLHPTAQQVRNSSGTRTFAVSVYESGSTDTTPAWLDLLRALLAALGVTQRVEAGGKLSRKRDDATERAVDRIEFLAKASGPPGFVCLKQGRACRGG